MRTLVVKMRQLTYDDFKDIEGDPSWSSLDYLAAVAEKAHAIYEHEEKEEEEKKAKEKPLLSNMDSRLKLYRQKECCIYKPNCMPCLSPILEKSNDCKTLASTSYNKRRRISEGNRCVESQPLKRAKIQNRRRQPDDPIPPLPEVFRSYIEGLAAGEPRPEVILVIQKRFFQTDLSLHHDRLSLPYNQLANNFLSEDEEEHLSGRDEDNHMNTLAVPLIYKLSPGGNTKVYLRRWDMRKDNGKTSVSYVITSWKQVVLKSSFEKKMAMQLWAFRLVGQLWFALVKVPEDEITRMRA